MKNFLKTHPQSFLLDALRNGFVPEDQNQRQSVKCSDKCSEKMRERCGKYFLFFDKFDFPTSLHKERKIANCRILLE